MASKSIRRMMGVVASVGAVAVLAAGPLVFAVQRPANAPAATVVVNAGITVNALNPSDDVHQISSHTDPTNHQVNSNHQNTTADFVISLSGVANGGSNFTAPISGTWHTQGNGSTTSFTPSTGSFSFPNKYAQQYKLIKIPVKYSASQFAEGTGVYTSFNLVIGSAVNATIGTNPAVVYIVNGVHGPNLP